MVRDKLPNLKLNLSITTDHFKISAIGCDQPCTMSASRKGDEDVEMQIAQLAGCIPPIGANLA